MKTNKLCLCVVLAWMASWAGAKTVNVFFAGGQSNAKAEWASAIAGGLQTGYGSTLVMVSKTHPGAGLSSWFTTTPQDNYTNDFWNASGTGALQSQIRAITNAGDVAVFQGIFWFQGETDTGSYASMDAYTNRVGGMLARIKMDLGLTNDIRLTYAVIDGNPDPYYDDPANSGGRTRADIDYLRAYQTAQGAQTQFAYVDTRGYTRADMWHVTSAELTRLGLAMSAAYTNKFGISLPSAGTVVTLDEYPETIDLPSHSADGSIYGSSGVFPTQDLINGVAGTTFYNGIAFFQLPNIVISDANLVLTVSSAGTLTNANIDVWALGYLSAPAMTASWLLQADTDSRNLLNGFPPTKIADNLVPLNQAANNGNVFQLNEAQRTNLTAYIAGLYARGAQPGDYVVIRTNPDAVMATTDPRNIRFAASSHANAAYRPKLTVTLTGASVYAGQYKHYSHVKDGTLFYYGTSQANDLICGVAGTGIDYNGVAFFTLPEQPVTSAKLALAVAEFNGALSGANIDVWGLGYVSEPTLNLAWFCTNNVDPRLLLNGRQPLKIADNVVTSGQTIAVGTVWSPTGEQEQVFKKWLNGLYRTGENSNGAKPGDYAVIRVNIDSMQYPFGARGVRWGASNPANANYRAVLSGEIPVTANYLVNSGFEAGAGVTVSNWILEANGFLGLRTNGAVRTGGYAYRMSVNGDQSANPSNTIRICQDINDASLVGKLVTFSGYARHNSDEPLVTNTSQKVEFQLFWLNGTTKIGSTIDTNPLLPTYQKNEYMPHVVSGVVPANATGVRTEVVFTTDTVGKPSVTNGAVIVDDLRLTVFEPPPPAGTQLWIR